MYVFDYERIRREAIAGEKALQARKKLEETEKMAERERALEGFDREGFGVPELEVEANDEEDCDDPDGQGEDALENYQEDGEF